MEKEVLWNCIGSNRRRWEAKKLKWSNLWNGIQLQWLNHGTETICQYVSDPNVNLYIVATHQYNLLAGYQPCSLAYWERGYVGSHRLEALATLGVFRPPGPEPSILPSSSHRNHGAPWEVARDNIVHIRFARFIWWIQKDRPLNAHPFWIRAAVEGYSGYCHSLHFSWYLQTRLIWLTTSL